MLENDHALDPRIQRLFRQVAPAEYPRAYAGVRLKMAKEFADFTGDDRKFRDLAADAGVDITTRGSNGYKSYQPWEIRKVRQLISKIASNIVRKWPPLIPFRITKGGTGKTTMCANVAACLAHFGFRVLLIDADPQGSASYTVGYNINVPNLMHIGHVLQNVRNNAATRIRDAVIPIYKHGMLDLIPANITLADEGWMNQAMSKETLFERLLEREREFFAQYDVVLIDCAPGTSLLANTIMAASDLVTAIVAPEPQALLGLFGLESNLAEINTSVRRNTTPVGMHIVINRFSQASATHTDSLEWLLEEFRPYLNDNIVKSYVGFTREIDPRDFAQSAPLIEKEPNSPGARNIIELTKSLINLYKVRIAANDLTEVKAA